MTDLMTLLKAARRVSAPLVAIETMDPTACRDAVVKLFAGKGNADAVPAGAVFSWDRARGLAAMNAPAEAAVDLMADMAGLGEMVPPKSSMPDPTKRAQALGAITSSPQIALRFLRGMPQHGVAFIVHIHRELDETGQQFAPDVVQEIANLRDEFKRDWRMLIALGPGFRLPAELAHDVMLMNEEYPDVEALTGLVTDLYQAAGLEKPAEAPAVAAAVAVQGLARFPAETEISMALRKDGVDVERLWGRKCAIIERTLGLHVYRSGETLDELGGLGQIKTYVTRLMAGRDRRQLVVWWEELEKMVAGATGDTQDNTGIAQDILQVFLTEMENKRIPGLLLTGMPGTGKSAMGKAIGKLSASGLTVAADLGAMKGGIVGETERHVRAAFKTIEAMSSGRPLFVATVNRPKRLPSELTSRFTLGKFYFELPDDDEKAAIWLIHLKKHGLELEQERPADAGWTGREIRSCCELAWRLEVPVKEAGEMIVPVALSDWEALEEIRRHADGRYLSASQPGVFRVRGRAEVQAPVRPDGRAIRAHDEGGEQA